MDTKNPNKQKTWVPGLNPDMHQPSWFAMHKVLGYIFIFTVLAALVVGAYYYQETVNNLDYFHFVQHHQNALFWKTYSNSKYGLTMKYPSSWHATANMETGGGKVPLATLYYKAKSGTDANMQSDGDMKINIAVYSITNESVANGKTSESDFDQWFDQFHKVKKSSTITNSTVRQTEFNSLPAISQVYNNLKPTNAAPSAYKDLFVKLSSDEVLAFSFVSPLPSGERATSALDKILSTAQLGN